MTARTLKTLCQDVAGGLGISQPNSVVGNTEETAIRLLGAYTASGRYLAGAQDWRELTFEHTLSTVSGTLEYALPSDPGFHHFRAATAYDRTNNVELIGPVSRGEYQRVQAWTTTGHITKRFAIRASTDRDAPQLVFAEDPAGAYSIAFEYVTDEWLDTGGGTYATAPTSDSNIALFDDYLMECQVRWRMLRTLGEPFASELDEANRIEDAQFGRQNNQVLRLSPRRFTGPNIPEGSWPTT